jgi:histone H4
MQTSNDNTQNTPATPPSTPPSTHPSTPPSTTSTTTTFTTPIASRRHRKTGLPKGVSNGDIRRLARRGGVKRINGHVYDDSRAALKDFLTTVIHDAVIYTQYAHRSTVTTQDVRYALKRNGRTLYGFA